jgi:hypothetical protein
MAPSSTIDVATLLAADEEPWPAAEVLDTRRAPDDVSAAAADAYDRVTVHT